MRNKMIKVVRAAAAVALAAVLSLSGVTGAALTKVYAAETAVTVAEGKNFTPVKYGNIVDGRIEAFDENGVSYLVPLSELGTNAFIAEFIKANKSCFNLALTGNCKFFNVTLYMNEYPEIAKKFNWDRMKVLEYYLTTGIYMGDKSCTSFDLAVAVTILPDCVMSNGQIADIYELLEKFEKATGLTATAGVVVAPTTAGYLGIRNVDKATALGIIVNPREGEKFLNADGTESVGEVINEIVMEEEPVIVYNVEAYEVAHRRWEEAEPQPEDYASEWLSAKAEWESRKPVRADYTANDAAYATYDEAETAYNEAYEGWLSSEPDITASMTKDDKKNYETALGIWKTLEPQASEYVAGGRFSNSKEAAKAYDNDVKAWKEERPNPDDFVYHANTYVSAEAANAAYLGAHATWEAGKPDAGDANALTEYINEHPEPQSSDYVYYDNSVEFHGKTYTFASEEEANEKFWNAYEDWNEYSTAMPSYLTFEREKGIVVLEMQTLEMMKSIVDDVFNKRATKAPDDVLAAFFALYPEPDPFECESQAEYEDKCQKQMMQKASFAMKYLVAEYSSNSNDEIYRKYYATHECPDIFTEYDDEAYPNALNQWVLNGGKNIDLERKNLKDHYLNDISYLNSSLEEWYTDWGYFIDGGFIDDEEEARQAFLASQEACRNALDEKYFSKGLPNPENYRYKTEEEVNAAVKASAKEYYSWLRDANTCLVNDVMSEEGCTGVLKNCADTAKDALEAVALYYPTYDEAEYAFMVAHDKWEASAPDPLKYADVNEYNRAVAEWEGMAPDREDYTSNRYGLTSEEEAEEKYEEDLAAWEAEGENKFGQDAYEGILEEEGYYDDQKKWEEAEPQPEEFDPDTDYSDPESAPVV